jgi:Fur family peroxide stress response transcriptional regulator
MSARVLYCNQYNNGLVLKEVVKVDGTTTDSLVQQLKSAGLRVTPQRLAIFSALVSTDSHPTAQALFEQLHPQLPSLSQATVYNTLQILAERGLILEIGTAGDGAVHYDGDPTPHVNLICTHCHGVQDLNDFPLGSLAKAKIGQAGFKIHAMRIAFYGQCQDCQDAAGSLRLSTGKGAGVLNESFLPAK